MNAEIPTTRRRGRRPTLSLEAILDSAIELLDEAGESALTFRALAARAGTGIGSLYHYVDGRDVLLDAATNRILGEVLPSLTLPDEPFEALRTLSFGLFEAMQAHPWAGVYLMRDIGMQPNSMKLFEVFGQQSLKLDLTTTQRFNAVSSLISFVVGSGAEMREPPPSIQVEGKSQEEYLRDYAHAWLQLDGDEYPFVHSIAGQFAAHDDLEQFKAGVDLFLAGVRSQLP